MKQTLPDNNSGKKAALSVEQLMRLKRAEHPSREFWDGFDEKLHQRIFETAVRRRESRFSIILSAIAHSRLTYAASATAAAAVVIGLTVARSGSVVLLSVPTLPDSSDMVVQVEAPAQAARLSNHERFVVDRLSGTGVENGSFRKVMAPQAVFVSSAGSTRYVADQVGPSSGRGVLTASSSF
jgi:hypothetical protein